MSEGGKKKKKRKQEGLTHPLQVIVTVDDINDNSPMCLEPFEGSVKENIEPGALVMKIKATDMDKGKNSELQFELLDQHELFSIDTISGDIILKKTLDRYNLTLSGINQVFCSNF